MNDIVFYALLATLGTWLVTALGAATVVLFKSPNPKILNLMLGFPFKIFFVKKIIHI